MKRRCLDVVLGGEVDGGTVRLGLKVYGTGVVGLAGWSSGGGGI